MLAAEAGGGHAKQIEKDKPGIETALGMADPKKEEAELGVVLVWNTRPQIGPHGYLTPFRRTESKGCVLFFAQQSLANPGERIDEGSLVDYRVDAGEDRLKVSNVKVKNFLSYDSRLDFTEEDIYDLRGFEYEIQDPSGPVLRFMRKTFSAKDLEDLDREPEYRSDGLTRLRDLKEDIIAERLNSIIAGPLIYDKKMFANVTLRNHTKKLLDKNPEESELRFLNRLLLEDGIASELPEAKPFPDCSMPVVQAKVLDFYTESKTGRLKWQSGVAGFDHNSFPSDSFIPKAGTKVKCRLLALWYDNDSWAYDIWGLSARNRSASTAGNRRNKPAPVPLTPPLQFDYAKKILIDAYGNPSRELPLRLADVLRAFFEHDGQDSKKLKLELSYKEIRDIYLVGRVRKKAPKATKQDMNFRLSLKTLKSKKFREDPDAYWATCWATDFRRWLKPYSLDKKGLLFRNEDGAREYYLVRTGWHATRPMVNRGEVPKKGGLDDNRLAGEAGGENVAGD